MCAEAQGMDLSKATAADVSRWRKIYEADGDVKACKLLRSLQGSIEADDILWRVEAEYELFELFVLERGVGL